MSKKKSKVSVQEILKMESVYGFEFPATVAAAIRNCDTSMELISHLARRNVVVVERDSFENCCQEFLNHYSQYWRRFDSYNDNGLLVIIDLQSEVL